MSNVRETSIKCFDEIKQENLYDSDMEMVLESIRTKPLMTAREYTSLVLGYDDMNKVRPRISDLKRLGYILEVGKRECSLSKRTAYIWATLEGIEQFCLRKVGFIEKEPNLFYFVEDNITLFQDFRTGKRRSYAFADYNTTIDYKTLDIYNDFKKLLEGFIKK